MSFPTTVFITSNFVGGCKGEFLSRVEIALRGRFGIILNRFDGFLDHRVFLPPTLGVAAGGIFHL